MERKHIYKLTLISDNLIADLYALKILKYAHKYPLENLANLLEIYEKYKNMHNYVNFQKKCRKFKIHNLVFAKKVKSLIIKLIKNKRILKNVF